MAHHISAFVSLVKIDLFERWETWSVAVGPAGFRWRWGWTDVCSSALGMGHSVPGIKGEQVPCVLCGQGPGYRLPQEMQLVSLGPALGCAVHRAPGCTATDSGLEAGDRSRFSADVCLGVPSWFGGGQESRGAGL